MSETRARLRRLCADSVGLALAVSLAAGASAAEKASSGGGSLPDTDGLRALVESDPGALGPLSIGTPDAGLLLNPEPMPPGPLWTVRDPDDAYATRETIGYLAAAIEAVEARFPGSPPLCIGDLSRADGGRLDRHRSHQAGRDADVGFYLRSGAATGFVRPGKNDLDLPRTWALVRAFVTETDVQRIFVDRGIQRQLHAYAVETGEDRAWLDELFGRHRGGKDAIVQHERKHQDHLHVRFYNPRAQEWGRLAYPLLVATGSLPGPTVYHRVRSGETISHLARRYGTSTAKIRAANGLRTNLLRAGRRYAVPVRAIPTLEPEVVPPRMLPPGHELDQRASLPVAEPEPEAAPVAEPEPEAAPVAEPDPEAQAPGPAEPESTPYDERLPGEAPEGR